MARFILLEASPWAVVDGSAVAIRLAGGGRNPYSGLRGFTDWRAGIAGFPNFVAAAGYSEQGWTGGAIPGTSQIRIFPSDDAFRNSLLSAYHWKGSPIALRSGDDDLATPVYVLELTGIVETVTESEGAIVLTVADLGDKFNVPAAPAKFAGTGGVEGPAEAEGRAKRRSWGVVRNVEGLLLEKPNNIFEFGDPAFPLNSFSAVKDMGRAAAPAPTVLAWQGSIAATFAALQASSPTAGSCVVAPSIACVKWWTVPAGPLTADLQGEVGTGYVNKAADIASRMVSAVDGTTTVTAADVTAINAVRPAVSGLHVGDNSETLAQALDRLLIPVNVLWGINPDGTVRLGEVQMTTPAETLTAVDVERVETFKPVYQVKLGYQKNHREHSDGEISAALLAADVTGLGALATQNTADLATQLVDSGSGTPTAIVPRNEVRTPLGIAAGFTGQGGLAIRSSLAYGDAALTGFGLLAPRNTVRFANEIYRANGTTLVADADAVTILGTAAGITGQAATATSSDFAVITGPTKPANNADVTANVAAIGDANRVRFSRFEGGTKGWTNRQNTSGNAVALGAGFNNGRAYILSTGTFSGAGQNVSICSNFAVADFRIPVYPSERLYVGALPRINIIPAGSTWAFVVSYLDSTGAAIGGSTQVIGSGSATLTPETFKEIFTNANAGAYFAFVELTITSGAAGALDFSLYAPMVCSAGPNQTARPSFNPGPFSELAATLGADINLNVIDGGAGFATVPRGELRTPLGIAAGFSGQGALATKASVDFETGDVTNKTRIAQLDQATGRVVDYRGLQSNRSYGLRSVYDSPAFSDTWVSGSTVTINIPASTLTTDTGATISLPSGSIAGVAFATKLYLYRDMADPASATGTYGSSSTLAGAMATGKVYLGYFTTRASSGATGGGGFGGGPDCVVAEAFVLLAEGLRAAKLVEAGDEVEVLDETTMEGTKLSRVESNHPALQECVRLTTESGGKLTLAMTTPITLRGGLHVIAANARGYALPVKDRRDGEAAFRWERVATVEIVGPRTVAHLRCGGATFAAGDEPDFMLYTHNPVKP